jgi:hypothetical protein
MYSPPFKEESKLKSQPVSRAASLKPVDTTVVLTNFKYWERETKKL